MIRKILKVKEHQELIQKATSIKERTEVLQKQQDAPAEELEEVESETVG